MDIAQETLDRLTENIIDEVCRNSSAGSLESHFENFFRQQISAAKITGPVSAEDFLSAAEAAYLAACLIIGLPVPNRGDLGYRLYKEIIFSARIENKPLMQEIVEILRGDPEGKRMEKAALTSRQIAVSWHLAQGNQPIDKEPTDFSIWTA